MSDKELTDALERAVYRVGVRPVLELLVDWIGRGLFLEVLENVADRWPTADIGELPA